MVYMSNAEYSHFLDIMSLMCFYIGSQWSHNFSCHAKRHVADNVTSIKNNVLMYTKDSPNSAIHNVGGGFPSSCVISIPNTYSIISTQGNGQFNHYWMIVEYALGMIKFHSPWHNILCVPVAVSPITSSNTSPAWQLICLQPVHFMMSPDDR